MPDSSVWPEYDVFPAHAGMNRRRPLNTGAALRVPRARGDEPSKSDSQAQLYAVFPAHAGMNRRCSSLIARSPSVAFSRALS